MHYRLMGGKVHIESCMVGGGRGILGPIRPSHQGSFPALWEALMLRPIENYYNVTNDCCCDGWMDEDYV